MATIPDAIRHKFSRIIEESKGDARFKKMLAMGSDDNFKWAYQFAYERAYGKPIQGMEISGQDGSPFSILSDEQFERFLEAKSRDTGQAGK